MKSALRPRPLSTVAGSAQTLSASAMTANMKAAYVLAKAGNALAHAIALKGG